MQWFSLLLLVLFQTYAASKDTLPVFLMDHEQVMPQLRILPNPFVKMGQDVFRRILEDANKNSECVIIFVEDTLCSEDISTKDNIGSPYHNLHQSLITFKTSFIPAVEKPYELLKEAFPPDAENVFYLTPRTQLQVLDSLKYLYIFFKDAMNMTRVQTLRNHDMIMRHVYFTVKQLKSGPVVGIYTGKVNPVVMAKVGFVAVKPKYAAQDLSVMVVSEGALFKFCGVFASTSARRFTFTQKPLIGEESWSRQKLSTTMQYAEFELQFNFRFEKKDWVVENVALLEGGEEVGRTIMGVGAPWDWSYVCAEPLSVVNTRDGSAVTISKYQIQPRYRQDNSNVNREGIRSLKADTNGTICFGKSVNCGPYFNTRILAGLFVTGIFLAIAGFAIVMLYNCGINSRFDDPDGKNIMVHQDGAH